MILERGAPDVVRPVVFCDACGEEIERAVEGMYLFDSQSVLEAPVDLYFAHKDHVWGGCWTYLSTALEAQGAYVGDEELSNLPTYLKNVLDATPYLV